MSASSGLVAEELCVLARRNPYDAGQRALWHLDSIGGLIDCRNKTLSEDLDLLCGTHQRSLIGNSVSSGSFSASDSENQSVSTSRYLKVGEKTRIKFFSPKAVTVFSLDLSPSMNVVDTSFKSVTTGCHLVDSLVRALEISLEALVNGRTSFFEPQILVTVIAHGVPSLGLFPLIVGASLTDDPKCISSIIQIVSSALRDVIQKLCKWLQGNHESEQLAGPANCSRTRNPCTSVVCQANDISTVIRDCLTAISLTCSQFGLSKAGVCKSILIVTDGVLAHPRKLPYDNVLMHLNFVDVTLHIIQVGGGFAPWSALGYASDPDLLRLLAASTPMGLFLQEHHIEPNKSGNALWVACTCKLSSITKRGHTPYKAASYQSSLLVGGSRYPTYVNHVVSEARLGRREFSLQLQGIEETCPSSVGSWSPILRTTSTESVRGISVEDEVSDSSPEEPRATEFGGPISLKAYLKPEKAKARPYLYKQYKLPNVSAAQLIQIRVREGFVVDTKPHQQDGGNKTLTSRLTRTSSSGALAPVTSSNEHSITLSIHWAAVVDIIYEISTESESQQILVKVYLRMPSGEFFLRFKQQVSAAGAGNDTHLNQMCRQLDGFVETMFSVDDCLAKISNAVALQEVSLWHRWFNVRNLFLFLKAEPQTVRLRHGAIETLLSNSREQLVKDLRRFPEITELEDSERGKRFLVQNLSCIDGNNHITNILSRSNESVLARAGGDSSFGAIRRTSLVVIDVPESKDVNTIGVVRLNVAFFASSPAMERMFVDQLSQYITCGTLVDSPSPIVRAVQAGIAISASRNSVVKKQQRRRSVAAAAVGMGGESFFTYEPDLEAVNRFMRYHAWDTLCPPAALASDVLATVHERRLREGWKCVFESNNSAIYLLFQQTDAIGKSVVSEEVQPARVEAKLANVDWEKLLKVPSRAAVLPRKAIRGACLCLAVQHVQARGEKPILKCRVWADRGNQTWKNDSEFSEFCENIAFYEKDRT
jgi:hypothetical protein